MQKINSLKKVFFFLLLSLVTITTSAQTGLNFQGVARNNNNVILASQQISLRLSILQGSVTGNAEYTEVRKVYTNAQGLFTAVIGDTGAISTLGNFATINWKTNPKFLKIEMDAAAGNNFITMGTTQFQSVAYAQFANSVDAENISGIVPVARGGTGANSLAGLKTALALDKSSVGLMNLDNTSDVLKPISSATQTALDLKATTTDVTNSLKLKEDLNNKSTDINLGGDAASDGLYPTQKAVKTYVAANTVIADGAITTAKLAELAVTDAKLATGISKSKVGLSDVENTALSTWIGNSFITKVGNIASGEWNGDVIAVNKGGTGGTNALQARRNLGLEIGTHVQAPLTADYDYLTPTGSANKLSNFPILNQSTTGNAATATLADRATISNNIDATSNTTLTSLPTLAEVGIITTGTWSGSAIAIANGGTGARDAINARVNLGLVIGTDIQAPLIAGADYLTPTGNAASATNVTGLVAIENGGTNSIAIPTAGGIGFGTGIAHAYSSAGTSGQFLTSNGGGAPTWVTPNTISVPYTGATSAVDLGAFDLKVNNLIVGVGAGNVPSNTVLGAYALNSNTTGGLNVANGFLALNANTIGANNVAVGASALLKNTNGNENTAIGALALNDNTDGDDNTATGVSALFYNTTGSKNIAYGNYSLQNNLTGSYNIAVGNNSLITNRTGNFNTVIGHGADAASDGLTNATAIGAGAIVNADNTIQLGNAMVRSVVTSGNISAAAYTGTWNGDIIDIAHGGTGTSTANFVDLSTDQNVSGTKYFLADANVNGLIVGKGAGNISSNTTLGRNALSNNTIGTDNTALGNYSLNSNIDGISNTGIGRYTLALNTSGKFNSGVGSNVLSSNVSGDYNSANGALALNSNTSGKYNTAMGYATLLYNSTGENNTAVGQSSLGTNTTGTDNTAIGANANVGAANLTNATAIGAGAIVSQSNSIQLGDALIRSVVTSGKISADGFITTTGTGDQFLKANGSVDGTTYVNKDAATISIGNYAGTSNQGIGSIAIGSLAGQIDQTSTAIAIGMNSGRNSQSVYSIAMGLYAGEDHQGSNSIAMGLKSGRLRQGQQAVSIGDEAGYSNQGANSIALGALAGKENQGLNSISIGISAGVLSQTANAIAIGAFAGNSEQGLNSIALGFSAGDLDQGASSIAIGHEAGSENQGASSIAIGTAAGTNNQGLNSIAIGTAAGNSNQAPNSIILNATVNPLNTPTATSSGFFVAPIQPATTSMLLYYNTLTNEISYGAAVDANASTLTGTTLASNIVNSSLTGVGTITSGTWSGTTIAVANGGTGLTSAGPTGNVLTSNGTDWVSAPITSSVDLTTAQTVSGSKSFTSDMRVGTATPTSSAVLEVSSTTQGFLPPRMTLTQRDAILSPATGLMIFCTNCTPKGDPEFYNGTRWISMMSAAPLANTIIGDQVWSSSNLNVGKYRNGDVIPQVTGTAWAGLNTGAWCWYNDDSVTYAATYGKLYNWYAVIDPRGLAPLGWHIPTLAEWNILTDYLGGTSVAGGTMKQTGTSLWTTPNTGATNTSGFTGLPGGVRNASSFTQLGEFGHWWSASNNATMHAWSPYLYYNDANSSMTYHLKNDGLSVRCVRD